MISQEIEQQVALETIECVSCGNVTAPDGKCLTVECEQGARQHTPQTQQHGSVVALPNPSAWTIRGGVD